MTYQEFKNYFTKNLSELYSISESEMLFKIFVGHYTKLDQFQLRKVMDEPVDKEKLFELQKMVADLQTGKPYQQILGETEFYGLKFYVDEHVLIPRPETEELLELAIKKIKESKLSELNFKMLDIGTGSGIIPVVLKKHFPQADILAIDFSENALKTAQRNADLHQVEINFIHQDYLNESLTEVYDVIISNPPYIGMEEENQIADSVKEFEPKMALFSPIPNALIFYEKIAKDCKNHLAKNGLIFLEINQKLGPETLNLFSQVLKDSELMKDLSGNDRFVWRRV